VTKQLQLLQEIVPATERVAVLAHAANRPPRLAAEAAAKPSGSSST